MSKSSIVGTFIAELRRREVIKTCVAYLGISWVILQVMDVASQMLIVDVIVGTFTFILLLCLFPVILYISWHFHFTGSGWERTAAVDLDEQGNALPLSPLGWGSWLGLLITVSLCLIIGIKYFDVIKERLAQEQEGIIQTISADSIAVLPFTDQSPEGNQQYLAIGLAEELTSLLGQTDGFRVAASRSSQILADKGLAPVDIGRRLDVQTILTGSVVNIGNRVKVRVELLDVSNGHTLWTENFLRELKDIFDLQGEIARSLVNLLQDRYLETGSLRSLSYTRSTDAYVIYLKAREQYRLQTTESFKQARKLFEQAVALDPEYAQAYIGLADTVALLGDGATQYGVLDNEVAATLAQGYIEKAILREPNTPEAFAVLGYIAMIRSQFEMAIDAFNKAIQLNPSLAIAYMWKNRALLQLNRLDESFEALQKAHELDPLFSSASYNLGLELARRGRTEEAKEVYSQLIADYPSFPNSYKGLADLYFNQGDYANAFIQMYKAYQISPDNEVIKFKVIGILFQLKITEIVKDFTDDPSIEPTILLLEGNYDALFKKMNFNVAANPDDYWVGFEAGWYQAIAGDKEKAASLIIKDEGSLETSDKFYMPLCSPAIEIAWAYQQMGEQVKAQNIARKCAELKDQQIKSGVDYHELFYLSARIDALNGNVDKSIANLDKAVTKGWREWWTAVDPLLQPLKAATPFNTLVKKIDDDLSIQRQTVLNYYHASSK